MLNFMEYWTGDRLTDEVMLVIIGPINLQLGVRKLDFNVYSFLGLHDLFQVQTSSYYPAFAIEQCYSG
jgi:hypothetical protein